MLKKLLEGGKGAARKKKKGKVIIAGSSVVTRSIARLKNPSPLK